MPPSLADFSVEFAIGYVGDQLRSHADNEYKRQLTRVLRFAVDAARERKDGVPLGALYSQRYLRELTVPRQEQESTSHAQTN